MHAVKLRYPNWKLPGWNSFSLDNSFHLHRIGSQESDGRMLHCYHPRYNCL